MNKHLAVAKAFAQEVQQAQPNIVAILLAGSVSRQQAAPFSDIDLMIIVPENTVPENTVPENEVNRVDRGSSTWRNGIYIDIGFRPQSTLADLEHILSNPSAATAIAFGTILYDPKGYLAALQAEVKAEYSQPRWIQARVQSVAGRIEARLNALRAAVAQQDAQQICIYAGPLAFSIALLPLIRDGIAPSSTRHLMQLAQHEPGLAESICTLEGASGMTRADFETAFNLFAQLTMLGDTSRWGQLPIYMMRKVEWMIQHDMHHGMHSSALHTMWNNVGFRIKDCLATPGMADQTQRLAQAWLQQTGWTGEAVLADKCELARQLIDQVSATPT